ncbi:MAG: hypothetical protein PWQ12_1322 [Clostridiales bacterium]|jgi:signal transduction histidine kinase|nr:hypothetical protein [Clostridiales bacterium]
MTLRKLWLIISVSVVILSIAINAIVLTTLTDHYFQSYLADSYDNHIRQIIEYASTSLENSDVSYSQMALELETHLDDPIVRIKLYNASGDLLVDVEDEYYGTGDMSRGHMMGFMMNSAGEEQVDQYDVVISGQTVGYLNVTIRDSVANSFVAMRFKSELFVNSLYSVAIALAVSVLIGIFVSKIVSKELTETAELAQGIQMGESSVHGTARIEEIRQIRDSLNELDMRLSLKQKSRKALVDELTHQTRTPLTILKTHVEAIEDGVIPVDSEEMATFKNQIDNITSIIENLSHMIDAEREVSKVEIKAFDLQELLNQIARGLKAQFDRKHIQFELESSSLEDESIQMLSDPYKLSQCVYNLLTNAYKYTPENGRVSVTYGLNGADVLIEIKDTGIGILPEELEKVFDAYYRGRLTSDHKGEGIGLYVARENAMQLGGTVRVTSRQGFGSTFTVTVPRKI